WVMGKLRPDHKTNAEFRRVHPMQLKEVTRTFVTLCRELDLIDGTPVVVDGTKLRVQNRLDCNYTAGRTARLLKQIEGSIAKHLQELDRQGKQEKGMGGP